MKIIKRGNFNNAFPIQVECKRVEDEYGFGYGDKKDFCNSLLEVEETDIKKHKWFKYPNYSGEDYGVICPVCGNFVVIDKSKLPCTVIATAKEIFLNN